MNRSIALICLTAVATLPLASAAAETEDTQRLRQEIQQLRQDYEQRIQALEQKLENAETTREPAAAASVTATATPPTPSFNPKIGLILQGTYADFGSDAEAEVPGFLLGPETEFRPEGFSLAETELNFEANVDDKIHAWATIALENEDGETVAVVEEAYGNSLNLPYGLALKAGRFFSDIGYMNRQHSHAWEFADTPLVYRAFFANQLRDDGLQLRWVAPTDLYIETGAELLRGDAFPAGGEDRSGVNLSTVFAHVGGDLGTDSSWRAGLSHIRADADDRRTGEDTETSFTGDSDITGLDFVYKWAPNGNPALRNFVLQGEYFVRDENGEVTYDPDSNDPVNTGPLTSAYDGQQKGFYLQGVYQWMPRWRAGLRYDRLEVDNKVPGAVAGTALETLAGDGSEPQRWSAMVDFSNSEFSRFRLQYNRDESRAGGDVDNQWLLQYIYALGAHPAHQF